MLIDEAYAKARRLLGAHQQMESGMAQAFADCRAMYASAVWDAIEALPRDDAGFVAALAGELRKLAADSPAAEGAWAALEDVPEGCELRAIAKCTVSEKQAPWMYEDGLCSDRIVSVFMQAAIAAADIEQALPDGSDEEEFEGKEDQPADSVAQAVEFFLSLAYYGLAAIEAANSLGAAGLLGDRKSFTLYVGHPDAEEVATLGKLTPEGWKPPLVRKGR